jgi:hypothetical protein
MRFLKFNKADFNPAASDSKEVNRSFLYNPVFAAGKSMSTSAFSTLLYQVRHRHFIR